MRSLLSSEELEVVAVGNAVPCVSAEGLEEADAEATGEGAGDDGERSCAMEESTRHPRTKKRPARIERRCIILSLCGRGELRTDR